MNFCVLLQLPQQNHLSNHIIYQDTEKGIPPQCQRNYLLTIELKRITHGFLRAVKNLPLYLTGLQQKIECKSFDGVPGILSLLRYY